MNFNKRFVVPLILSLFLLLPSYPIYAYTPDSYEKFYYTGPYYGSYFLYSPFRDGSGNQDYSKGVTSKYNNPRSLSSSPHGGVDFSAASNTNVYPISSGQVVYVYNSIDASFGKYVVVRLDINGDNTLDSVYSRHAHLNSINVSQGQNVSATTLLGLSGSTGTTAAHLHVDMRDNNNTGNGVYHSLPWQKYYSDRSAWNYGRDMDWASQHYATGRTFSVNCYGKTDGSQDITPSEVKLWVRRSGTSDAWTGYSMSYSAVIFLMARSPCRPTQTSNGRHEKPQEISDGLLLILPYIMHQGLDFLPRLNGRFNINGYFLSGDCIHVPLFGLRRHQVPGLYLPPISTKA